MPDERDADVALWGLTGFLVGAGIVLTVDQILLHTLGFETAKKWLWWLVNFPSVPYLLIGSMADLVGDAATHSMAAACLGWGLVGACIGWAAKRKEIQDEERRKLRMGTLPLPSSQSAAPIIKDDELADPPG